MNIAAEARAAAMHFECKKDGLSQLQDGSWVLKIKVHPSDVPAALLTAPMGTRFVAALVEVAGDETPVSPAEQEQRAKPVKERKRWSELPLSQQAVLAGKDEKFRQYMTERIGVHRLMSEEDCAHAVRVECEAASRRQIEEGTVPGALWKNLYADYRFWLQHRENA